VAIVAGKSDARVIPIKQAKTPTFENTYDHVPPSPGFRILRGRPTEGAFFCALLTRLSALLQMASKFETAKRGRGELGVELLRRRGVKDECQPAEKWIVMKSMFISVAMLLALSVPALADDDKNKGDNGGVRSGTGQVELTIEADDELRLIVRRRAASGSMTNIYDHTFSPVYKAAAAKRIKKGTPAEAKANAKPSIARNM